MNSEKDILIKWAVILFGALFILFPAKNLSKAFPAKNWPSVEGRILSSSIESSPNLFSRLNNFSHKVRVIYSYQVDGEKYESKKISFGKQPYNFKSIADAKSLQYRLKEGKNIDVYYDPSTPNRSILFPGENQVEYLFLGFGILLVLYIGLNWNNPSLLRRKE